MPCRRGPGWTPPGCRRNCWNSNSTGRSHACLAACFNAWRRAEASPLACVKDACPDRPYLRYIENMFEVLVYVYENYWQGDACPELPQLGRKLTAAGFDAEEIQEALVWLDGLNVAAQGTQINLPARASSDLAEPATAAPGIQPQSANSLRVYSVTEQVHLGAQSLGSVSYTH